MSTEAVSSSPRRSNRLSRDALKGRVHTPTGNSEVHEQEICAGAQQREVDLNNVADEVEIEDETFAAFSGGANVGPSHFYAKTTSLHPKKVLLTEESLQCEPILYAPLGRRRKRPAKGGLDDDAPVLQPQIQKPTSTVSNMRAHFQMHATAQIKKANLHEISEAAEREQEEQQQREFRRLQLQRELDTNFERAADGVEVEDMEALEMMDVEPESDAEESEALNVERNQEMQFFEEWPLYWDHPVDFQEACDILMGMRRVPQAKQCRSIPQCFRGEGTFVIDMRNFPNRNDVALDGLGSWGKPTGRTRFFTLDSEQRPVRADDSHGHLVTPTYAFKVMLKRYEHPKTLNEGSHSKFVKKIVTAVFPPERRMAVAMAVITYEWIGTPFDFEFPNSRSRRVAEVPSCGARTWEEASFNTPCTGSAHGITLETPLYATGAVDFGVASSIILGGENVDVNKVCCRVPQGYRENGTFVIDIRNLANDIELRRDANGVWGKPAGHSRYYKIEPDTGDAVRVDRGNKLIAGADYDVQILSKRYEHPSVGGRFVRKIYTARTANGESSLATSTLAVITYYWKGEPEPFEAGPQRRVLTHKRRVDVLVEAHEPEEEEIPGPSATIAENPRRNHVNGGVSGAQVASEEALRALVSRKELENQDRLSAILDRVEHFLDRLERAGDSFLEQIWGAGRHAEGVLVDEADVVQHAPHNTFHYMP